MANEREVNEVIINNQVIMTTRRDTVSQDNLVRDETATNKAGQKIVGELDVEGLMAKTYMITDPIDQIEERDYIPFNDVSDAEMPKKKTLFSNIIQKLKNTFLGNRTNSGEISMKDQGETPYPTLDLIANNVDASYRDNNVTSIVYPSTSNILDRMKRIIMRTEVVVNPDGNIGWKAYVRNYNVDGSQIAQKGMQFHMDKSGNLSYIIHDPNAFRKAINTVEQLGVALTSGTNIDNYHGNSYCGTYYIPSDAIARQITTLPNELCGKLIVANNGNGGFSQYYIPNHSVRLYIRVWWSNAWSAWTNIAGGSSPSGNYAYVDGSNITSPNTFRKNIRTIDQVGIKIPSGSDLNNYKTAGTYYVQSDTDAGNISNTPNSKSGKLIVLYKDNASGYRLDQLYLNNGGTRYYMRHMNYESSWTTWKAFAFTDDISPSQIGNGCGAATINGSAVTATITGFQLRTGVIVSLSFSSSIPVNATLNINNTGAKDIYWWERKISGEGDRTGLYGFITFMYDGTRYRIIAINHTPRTTVSSDYVADTSGTIKIDGVYDQNAFELKYKLSSDTLMWNYYKNSEWHGDIDIIDKDYLQRYTNFLTETSNTSEFRIPENADLNDYTASGTYQCTNGNIAATLSNCPIGNSFKLIVDRAYTNSSSEIMQKITMRNNNDCAEFVRVRTWGSSTWSNWKQYATTDNVGSNNFVGTCTTAAEQQVKVITLSNFVLFTGALINVRFSNTNTFNSQTSTPVQLNVNNTGAKNIWYNNTHSGAGNTGTNTRIYGEANRVFTYIYDGTYWVWVSCGYEADTVEPCWIGFGYGTCDTAEATTAKVVSLTNYTLRTGGYVTVKFTNAVPASATMNINSKGAKNIWYRGANITANIIGAGDLATFIYDGTRYQLVGVDRFNVVYTKDNITILSSINSCATAIYVEGNLNGNQLFYRIEITFKPTSAITVTTSDTFITFNGLKMAHTNGFNWQDLQAYFNYTTMIPVVIGDYSSTNGFVMKFRTNYTFNANTTYTFRINFTTTAKKM